MRSWVFGSGSVGWLGSWMLRGSGCNCSFGVVIEVSLHTLLKQEVTTTVVFNFGRGNE